MFTDKIFTFLPSETVPRNKLQKINTNENVVFCAALKPLKLKQQKPGRQFWTVDVLVVSKNGPQTKKKQKQASKGVKITSRFKPFNPFFLPPPAWRRALAWGRRQKSFPQRRENQRVRVGGKIYSACAAVATFRQNSARKSKVSTASKRKKKKATKNPRLAVSDINCYRFAFFSLLDSL